MALGKPRNPPSLPDLNFDWVILITISVLFPSLRWVGTGQNRLSEQSPVLINGIGALRVGMTLAEAEKAAGMRLIHYPGWPVNDRCYLVIPEDLQLQIGLMISEGKVVRVDIWENSQVKTLSGAGIGDSEERIFALYPGQIEVREHPYLGERGNYLTFVPLDAVDQNYRVVFETVEGYVRQYRAGQLPQVGHIEGCN